jgi:hypothetical protein
VYNECTSQLGYTYFTGYNYCTLPLIVGQSSLHLPVDHRSHEHTYIHTFPLAVGQSSLHLQDFQFTVWFAGLCIHCLGYRTCSVHRTCSLSGLQDTLHSLSRLQNSEHGSLNSLSSLHGTHGAASLHGTHGSARNIHTSNTPYNNTTQDAAHPSLRPDFEGLGSRVQGVECRV